uniref:Prostate and testis expressed protein 2 n=1 Tax=Phascolarctos cinereus TaxID=38626 RepID=A0A6P5LK94_PHACI|nr:prostate and testis expressed protein 2 [Phascolarctos cinereus]
MDKLFLLGLSVLYLSRDGESTFGFLKEYDQVEGVACHVCKRFVNGRCLESKDSCVKEVPSGCETKVFYLIVNHVWQSTYARLNCNSVCKETEGIDNGMHFKIFCCNQDYCNKPQSGGI